MKKQIQLLCLLIATILTFSTCTKLNLERVPFLGETSVNINQNTGVVTVTSVAVDVEEVSIVEHGHLWSSTIDPVIPAPDPFNPFADSTHLGNVLSGSDFSSTLRRLDGNSSYYVRPYLISSDNETIYGESVAFETPFNSFLDMVQVNGGTMRLGSFGAEEEFATTDELPAEPITVSSFRMSRYEVSQRFWVAVMRNNPSLNLNRSLSEECLKCPVENVSWNDVQIFLEELNRLTGRNFRLPTEAEWEFAARGGNKQQTRFLYSGSDEITEVAWHKNNSGVLGQIDASQSHEVGLLKANELGLYDMTGNVIEWCSDWFYNQYYSDGRTSMDPMGPPNSVPTLLQGGDIVFPKTCRSCSFFEPDDFNKFCRLANRNPFYEVDSRNGIVGFRFVESLN